MRPAGLRRLWPGRETIRALGIGLLFPLALLAVWSAASAGGWLPDQLAPAPASVWSALVENAESGDLWTHTLISVQRVAEGFALGAGAGLVLGAALGLSPALRNFLDPLFLFLAQVPTLGWIPLMILVLGIDEAMKVAVIAWASFVPVVLNFAQGIRDVPEPLHELGRVLTFDPWYRLTRIVLPASVPSIFTGLREGVANAWQTMVGAELFASTEGLGYLISYGRQLFQLDVVLAMVVVLGLLGLIINGAFSLAEQRLLRWQARVA
jgi:sulfonate transport system permease protein